MRKEIRSGIYSKGANGKMYFSETIEDIDTQMGDDDTHAVKTTHKDMRKLFPWDPRVIRQRIIDVCFIVVATLAFVAFLFVMWCRGENLILPDDLPVGGATRMVKPESGGLRCWDGYLVIASGGLVTCHRFAQVFRLHRLSRRSDRGQN